MATLRRIHGTVDSISSICLPKLSHFSRVTLLVFRFISEQKAGGTPEQLKWL